MLDYFADQDRLERISIKCNDVDSVYDWHGTKMKDMNNLKSGEAIIVRYLSDQDYAGKLVDVPCIFMKWNDELMNNFTVIAVDDIDPVVYVDEFDVLAKKFVGHAASEDGHVVINNGAIVRLTYSDGTPATMVPALGLIDGFNVDRSDFDEDGVVFDSNGLYIAIDEQDYIDWLDRSKKLHDDEDDDDGPVDYDDDDEDEPLVDSDEEEEEDNRLEDIMIPEMVLFPFTSLLEFNRQTQYIASNATDENYKNIIDVIAKR